MTEKSIIPDKIIDTIKNRFLTEKDYSFESDPSKRHAIELSDKIILYNSGNQWKIIPLTVCLSYPIIYETYAFEDEKYDVTIVVCPVTLRSVMFKGKFIFRNYLEYRMILEEEDNNPDLLPIDLGKKINRNFVIQDNKRIEIKIMTLRNAIIYAPDAAFMKCHKKIDPIIDISYYTDNKNIDGTDLGESGIHPKTLVYVVNYSSEKSQKDKYVVLLPHNFNRDVPSGYNIIESKLNDHLIKYRSKLINKDGYLMPMLWYVAKKVYKKNRIRLLKSE
jgi:hypothetical protein